MIQAFYDDGLKLFEARPDVTYETIEGTLEELAEKIADADGVTIVHRGAMQRPDTEP